MSLSYALPAKPRTLSLSRIPLPMGEVMIVAIIMLMAMMGG